MKKFLSTPLANILLNILLASAWLYFGVAHFRAFVSTGNYSFLIFCLSETLQAFFFLLRTEPKTVSRDPFSWLVAFGGTFAVLCFRPAGAVLWTGGEVLLVIGVLIQTAALFSLNRSFALVAANRNVKTGGLYRLVRHPMYASYLLSDVGYVLFNMSVFNLAALFFALIFLFLRIVEEERHLNSDPAYVAYASRVRYRLIPFVY